MPRKSRLSRYSIKLIFHRSLYYHSALSQIHKECSNLRVKRNGNERSFGRHDPRAEQRRKIVSLRIPQSEYAIVSEIMRLGNIVNQDYEENDVLLEVDLPVALEQNFKKYVLQS